MGDLEIIKSLRNNKDDGFLALVERYQNMVFRTCYSYLKNVEDAEDITQEVFIKAYQKIDYFRGDSSISTWLYRIAINKSLNYIRDNKYHKLYERIETLFSDNIDKNDHDPLTEKNPEKQLILNETEQLLQKALASLPKNQRTAFILDKYNELSYKEIADVMKTSVSSVQSLIHRAKKGLQKKLFSYYKSSEKRMQQNSE